MLERTNPEFIYGVTPMPEDIKGIKFFREVALGTGGVNFTTYLKALEEIGYRGFLTIEREAGDQPAVDINIAKEHLLAVMNAN
jgi:sugar phosphate isomerase/epimerase